MTQYTYDLGIESSKIMNAVFSMKAIYTSLQGFFLGNVSVNKTKLIE